MTRPRLTGFSTDTSPPGFGNSSPALARTPHLYPLGQLHPTCFSLRLCSPQGEHQAQSESVPPRARLLTCKTPRPSTEAGSFRTSSFLTRAATVHFRKLGRRAQPPLSTSKVRWAPRSRQNGLPSARPSLVLRSQHPGPSTGLHFRPGAGGRGRGAEERLPQQRREGRAQSNGPARASALSRRLWSPSQTPGRNTS